MKPPRFFLALLLMPAVAIGGIKKLDVMPLSSKDWRRLEILSLEMKVKTQFTEHEMREMRNVFGIEDSNPDAETVIHPGNAGLKKVQRYLATKTEYLRAKNEVSELKMALGEAEGGKIGLAVEYLRKYGYRPSVSSEKRE